MNTSPTLQLLLKNKTNGRKVIGAILNDQELDQPFSHSTISTLLEYHPEKNTTPLAYCVMRVGKYGSPTLFYKRVDDDNEDSISWICCIENVFGKYDKTQHNLLDVTQAMRSAIAYQTMLYKSLHTDNGYATCAFCKQLCAGRYIHTDHFSVPFKHLLEEFCKVNTLELSKIEVQNGMLVDVDLMCKWQTYHDEIATYQILCAKCNISKGCKVIC